MASPCARRSPGIGSGSWRATSRSYSRVSDIPDEATRASVIRYGAAAGATIGFSIKGVVAGCVTFATTRQEREWAEPEIGRLQLVSRVFASAIARQRGHKALVVALAQVQTLSERLRDENAYLRSEVEQVLGSSPVVGQSPPILAALELVAQVAPTDSSVLLLGETGTGKELFANQVHELSARHKRLMVRVNCAAIPDTLLESELFGREKGAYTGALTRQTGRFELADKSTIFLDEIGDLPLEVQVKLLRVLEDRQVERLGSSRSIQVDVRIVAATHRNLEEMVAAGTFREDLYYRLNVFPIRVPPLRERPDDIPLLVWRFIGRIRQALRQVVDRYRQGEHGRIAAPSLARQRPRAPQRRRAGDHRGQAGRAARDSGGTRGVRRGPTQELEADRRGGRSHARRPRELRVADPRSGRRVRAAGPEAQHARNADGQAGDSPSRQGRVTGRQ